MPFFRGELPGTWRRAVGLVALAVLVLPLFGCGSKRENVAQIQSNLRPLAMFYGQFQGRNGRAPASEVEFKAYLRALPPADLTTWGATDVDGLFVSSRDGQPYVVLYGDAAKKAPGPADSRVIAYEKTGVGGKRFVATVLGSVEEVDEARFGQLVSNPP